MLSTHPWMDTSCFHLLAIVNTAAMNVGVPMSLWVPVCHSFGSVTRSGISESDGNFMFMRNLHIASSSTLNLVAEHSTNTHSPSLHLNPEQPLQCFCQPQPESWLIQIPSSPSPSGQPNPLPSILNYHFSLFHFILFRAVLTV